MSETMIDRVAKALFEKASPEFMWSDATDFMKAETRGFARIALEAMRGPTELMILAGVHHDNMGDMAGRWNAMVDEAMK